MVEIKGLEKFAPKDYPGKISATFFLGGCNYRCPFCHNAGLVLNPDDLPGFPIDYILGFLDDRTDWLDGICISGGEPFFHEDIDVLLRVIKERNLLVKVDTNGAFPERIEAMVQQDLVDHIAMDIKSSPEKYDEASGVPVNMNNIYKSIEILLESGLDHTFRVTAVPGLVDFDEIEKIGRMIKGGKVLQLQSYYPEEALDKEFRKLTPFPIETLYKMGDLVKPFINEVRIEGDKL